jgi:hypothetical protein
MYSDGVGLLPIEFFVTFDNFRTIGRCQLAWRRRDHIGVVFERWVDAQRGTTEEQKKRGRVFFENAWSDLTSIGIDRFKNTSFLP